MHVHGIWNADARQRPTFCFLACVVGQRGCRDVRLFCSRLPVSVTGCGDIERPLCWLGWASDPTPSDVAVGVAPCFPHVVLGVTPGDPAYSPPSALPMMLQAG